MKKLGELMMILDLHRQGVKIAGIARQLGVDCKTVRKQIARGVEVPTYGPRQPRERLLDPDIHYLRARLEAHKVEKLGGNSGALRHGFCGMPNAPDAALRIKTAGIIGLTAGYYNDIQYPQFGFRARLLSYFGKNLLSY
jgi:hypothetical protein